MYLLLSQRGPVEVVVSVLCKGWTVSVGTEPRSSLPTAAVKKRGMTLDGCMGCQTKLWLSVLIFACVLHVSLSCDPCPVGCAHASAARYRGGQCRALPGPRSTSVLLDLHDKCKPNQPPKPFQHVPERGQVLLCREGSCGNSGSIPAWGECAEPLPGSPLPSVGYRATAMGLYSIWLLDAFAHHVAKVTEKGCFLTNIPISSPSLEQASPAVSGMSGDPAVFLTHCTGRFWALAHKYFCICPAGIMRAVSLA